MSLHQLASHNPDLQKLVDTGYAVAIEDGYLVVRDVPYLDDKLELQVGAIVTKYKSEDKKTISQEDHQIFFAGSHPHGLHGQSIPNLGGGPTLLALSDACKDVVVQRSFSNKRSVNGSLVAYDDFFDKIESYVNMISGPAIEKFQVIVKTFRHVEGTPDSVFHYHDTLTSRAEIGDLSRRFAEEIVAVIGLGGTGSYVVDYLVKTPVQELRGFDKDIFHVHNAYRSPGRLTETELKQSKAAVLQARYEGFRKGLRFEQQFIDESSAQLLEGVTFAFVCVDKASSRAVIFDLLIKLEIPFIDVGMGINRNSGEPLTGLLRTVYYSKDRAAARQEQRLSPLVDDPKDEYRNHIQLSELNALNASLAVIKYKQFLGFYAPVDPMYTFAFDISDMKVVGELDTE